MRRHGVIMPARRTHNIPARVINVKSRKRQAEQKKIRLDKLIESPHPTICIERRLGGIGDVLMSTPLLRRIKELIPNCYLIYATDTTSEPLADVIQHNPYVDELINYRDALHNVYDYRVDITATGLSREKSGTIPPNRIDMFAEEVGISVDSNPLPIYVLTQEEKNNATKEINEKYLLGKERKDVKLISIQPRSNDSRRTWPLESTKKLIKYLLQDESIRILLYDWGNTCEQWEDIDRCFKIFNRKFNETAALIEQSDLMVCPDSSLLHLAGAFNKKIVTIFGPIPPESRINHYTNATAVKRVVKHECCWYVPKCVSSNDKNKLACLNRISPEQVLAAIKDKFKEPYKVLQNTTYGKDISVGNQDNTILVERTTSGMGDLICALNGIEALKRKFPNKQLHLSCPGNLHDAVLNNPFIDKIIDCNSSINYKNYFMKIDISSPCTRYEVGRLHQNKTVEKTRTEIFSEALGTQNFIIDILPRYYVSNEENKIAKELLEKHRVHNNKPFIGLALRSMELYRDYPNTYTIELINKLKEVCNVIVTGMEQTEVFDNKVIDIRGVDLRILGAIINNVDGVVSVDTGTLHIAGALRKPIIAVFGPIDPIARVKKYKDVTVVTSKCEHMPCWRNGITKCKVNNRIQANSVCIEKIYPNKLFSIIKNKFNL